MDKKLATKIVLSKVQKKDSEIGLARGEGRGSKRSFAATYNVNSKEDAMVNAIDNRQVLSKYADWITALREGKTDVPGFLDKMSPDLMIELMTIAMTGKDKIKLEAIRDMLDRAGYGKVNKVAVAGTLDAKASKEELLSTILGLGKKTGTIDVVDDDEFVEVEVDDQGEDQEK